MQLPFITPAEALDCPVLRRDFPAESAKRATLEITGLGLYRAFINMTMMSCAKTCIVPIQDWLGLDNSCRMNQPGTVGKNWRWRALPGVFTPELAKKLRNFCRIYGRLPAEPVKSEI